MLEFCINYYRSIWTDWEISREFPAATVRHFAEMRTQNVQNGNQLQQLSERTADEERSGVSGIGKPQEKLQNGYSRLGRSRLRRERCAATPALTVNWPLRLSTVHCRSRRDLISFTLRQIYPRYLLNRVLNDCNGWLPLPGNEPRFIQQKKK